MSPGTPIRLPAAGDKKAIIVNSAGTVVVKLYLTNYYPETCPKWNFVEQFLANRTPLGFSSFRSLALKESKATRSNHLEALTCRKQALGIHLRCPCSVHCECHHTNLQQWPHPRLILSIPEELFYTRSKRMKEYNYC